MGTPRRITELGLRGIPGLRREARTALLELQPKTVREARAIPGVAYSTTRRLLARKLLTDPDGIQPVHEEGVVYSVRDGVC